MSKIRLSRVLGAATAAYGAATIASPKLLTGPTGLAAGEPPAGLASMVRSVGVRDVAIGAAAALCPAGPVLRTALVLRIAADLGDAVVLGRALRGSAQAKTVGVALGWGVLNAVALTLEWQDR